ncbi:MAG: hypothetical protein ACUVTZ_04995, partial [Armatimonadota bacterium]
MVSMGKVNKRLRRFWATVTAAMFLVSLCQPVFAAEAARSGPKRPEVKKSPLYGRSAGKAVGYDAYQTQASGKVLLASRQVSEPKQVPLPTIGCVEVPRTIVGAGCLSTVADVCKTVIGTACKVTTDGSSCQTVLGAACPLPTTSTACKTVIGAGCLLTTSGTDCQTILGPKCVLPTTEAVCKTVIGPE